MIKLLVVAGVVLAFCSSAFAQATAPPNATEDLIGGTVFAAGSIEVGKVAGVSIDNDGKVTELRITTASPLGLGERMVIAPQNSYMLLRGAVVIDLSPSEVDALPSAPSG